MTKKLVKFLNKYKSYILLLIVILLTMKVFLPQLDTLKEGILSLKQANKTWVIVGTIVYWSGLPIVTKQYQVLAKKIIPFWLTLKVQIAGLFVGKLLPSSLGTLTLNSYYLMQKKHSAAEVSSVMAVNAITSGLAYVLLAILFLYDAATVNNDQVTLMTIIFVTTILIALLCLVVFFIYRIPPLHRFINAKLTAFMEQVADYKNEKGRLAAATVLNGIGSLTSMFALYASAQALGLDVELYQTFIAYTFGNIVAGLVPVPGGMGATEAGLYATFVAMGYDESATIAAVFLYRLITFWIPAVPGIISFVDLRRDVLKSFRISTKQTVKQTSK